ncbi:N-acetyltransferase [Mucilaginibacter robiniae]|uniref:N-acetyltransferase n=1 Tax=Mucilaginibacter robiniae TaxID=2728022 RepID=A0A7L5E7W6_9SPHI|nr:N-acetyltransferase [Mucilaginibacter robiniae]
MTIRDAKAADLPYILDIYNHAITHTTAVYQETLHTLEMREAWFAEKQASGFPVWVAVEGEQVVGFCTYGPFRNWPGYRFTVEHSVYLAPSHQGKGIGRLLVEHIINHAREQGNHVLIAGIDADTIPSIRLHQSLGFTEVAHFKQVGYKFGRWLDLKFLQLILQES